MGCPVGGGAFLKHSSMAKVLCGCSFKQKYAVSGAEITAALCVRICGHRSSSLAVGAYKVSDKVG